MTQQELELNLATLIQFLKMDLEAMKGTQKFVSEKASNDSFYAGSKSVAELSVRTLENLLKYAERA